MSLTPNDTQAVIASLKRKIAELQKDKERLRWAILYPQQFTKVCHDNCGGFEDEEIERTRQAIDAVIKKRQKLLHVNSVSTNNHAHPKRT